MNDFFNHTSRFVPGTIARAEDVNNVFDSVSTGFDLATVDMDSRSLRSGDTYTGTHNFTGATVTVATPTQDSHAVTKLFAENLAFLAGTFPDQAGNEGKIITTNGTAAFWSAFDAGTF